MLARFCFRNLNSLNRCLGGEAGKWHSFHSTPSFKSKCVQQKCDPSSGEKKKLMDIGCKVAIITGGTSGIGYACAEQLLCEGLNKAVIAGINKCEGDDAVKMLNARFGKDKAIFYKLDVNCHKQFEDLFIEVLNRYQHIDILVNNAGMLNDRHWELTVETNIKGVIRGTLLAFQYMAVNGTSNKGEGGIVVNVASILGLDALPPIPIYSTSKHAVIGVTKNFGDCYHFKDTQLRVTAMCPGVTPTALINEALGKQLNDKWGQDAELALQSWPKQPPSACGKACVHMVRYAPTGTAWIIEGSKLYRADIPERKTIAKFIESFL